VFVQQVTTYLQRATAERLPIARAEVIPPLAQPVARQPEIAEMDLSELTPAGVVIEAERRTGSLPASARSTSR
jgi:hypothetical protein